MIISFFKSRGILLFLTCFMFGAPSANAQSDTTTRLNLQQQLPSNDLWWQMFGDASLDSLIQKAVRNNYNLANALNNIDVAKAQLRIRQSGFYPTIDVTGNYTVEKSSLGITHVDQRDNIGEASVNMNWEIDVFGSIRKAAKSQKQYYYASQENYRAVMISLVAQLSSTYINLRTAQQQLSVANRNLESQKEILDLTELRYKSGLTTQLSVAQARGLYLQTKALTPAMESMITQQINTLCVLTGEYSLSLQKELAQIAPIPKNTEAVITGIPAELIRQRPDVRAAERTMDALSAAAGATRADWWPKFFVTGSFGYGAKDFSHFTDHANMAWQVVPTIQWTIFSGRQAVQTTRVAMLKLDEEINNFNNTILIAIQEVDNALVAYKQSLKQLEADREAFAQAQLTLNLAIELYRKGLADYQSVLDSQRNLLSFESSLVSSQGSTQQAMIQLYKALGGGWQIE